jgi:type 1 glutamine amidotransferase
MPGRGHFAKQNSQVGFSVAAKMAARNQLSILIIMTDRRKFQRIRIRNCFEGGDAKCYNVSMKTLRGFCLWALTLLFLLSFCASAADSTSPSKPSEDPSGATKPGKIRVLVVTGGHEFEHDQFFKLFSDNPEISFRAVEHPNAHGLLKPESAKDYDVLVAYDMHQEISDAARADLLSWLKAGKGFVVLHHAIASYQQWPEYSKIIGAHYYLQATNVDGVEKARSTYKHGMHFTIHVVDPNHPVTKGVRDFEITDETYNLFDVAKDVHPLLTTDEPDSNKVIGWAKNYGPARVVYLQSGHDHTAYENPNYLQILKQAIRWTARRD